MQKKDSPRIKETIQYPGHDIIENKKKEKKVSMLFKITISKNHLIVKLVHIFPPKLCKVQSVLLM
jgi:hypothetical protein